ncbi:MAG: hypothetical protein KA105_02560 [Caulobacter sp.]|nr:hypothetical protein [Caulobacter sp.]
MTAARQQYAAGRPAEPLLGFYAEGGTVFMLDGEGSVPVELRAARRIRMLLWGKAIEARGWLGRDLTDRWAELDDALRTALAWRMGHSA